jgi:hypothetical protein
MRCTLLASTLVYVALLSPAAPARAAERANVNRRTGLFEPPLSDLRKAAERGDRAELARTASRLGPARLAKGLADPDRRTVVAALEGIPLLPSGILLLDPITALAGASDPALREPAISALAALLGGSDPSRLDDWEIPAASTRAACQALAAAAGNEKEAVGLRLAAVQGLADAGVICAASFDPTKLLSSADPELRRAAVLALPASPAAGGALQAAAKDRDIRVAAAAGARLCARRSGGRASPGEPSLAVLVLADGAPLEDVIEMLPCLVASKDAADGKALEALRASGPAPVRAAIKSLQPAGKSGN